MKDFADTRAHAFGVALKLDEVKALIERLEKAEGPSRELDAEIWCVVNGNGQPLRKVGPPTYSSTRLFCNPHPEIEWVGYDLLATAPHYTGSRDAADALAPDGCYLADEPFFYSDVGQVRHSAVCVRPDWNKWSPVDDAWIQHLEGDGLIRAATPALARCIAALEAQTSFLTAKEPAETDEGD